MSNSLKQGFPRDITAGGLLKIDIAEGKEIHLEIPVEPKEEMSGRAPSVLFRSDKQKELYEDEAAAHSVRHVLKNCAFPVTEVRLGERTSFEDGVLTVRKSLEAEAQGCNDLVKSAELDIIYPDKQHVYTNSMMDVQPIAVKKEGMLGEGTTFEMTGVYMMLTGTDEAGLQIADANVSNGIYEENVEFGRPGAPDRDAFIIRLNVTIQEGCGMERPGPLAAHQALDIITQELREVLKEKDASTAAAEREYLDVERQGALRILLVKEIMGQGAMHDNLILPDEPCGFLGGRPNVDLGNVPVLLRPNEVLDGGIHALTCITPDTKEYAINASNSRHWYPPVKRYIDELLAGRTGPRGKDYNTRWIAALVAEIHRILNRGGVFMYPADQRNPAKPGHLRLLYEANPMAMLIEQAGGAATDGRQRILDIQPTGLHQRVPLFIGAREEVERVTSYHLQADQA